MAKALLIGRLVTALGLAGAAIWYAWDRPGTAAVWLAAAYMVWP